MTRVLLDKPGYFTAEFKVTTTSRGKTYSTIETGRGRAFSVKRDWEEALLNATYNAVYKHVIKPRGKSDPIIELLDWKVEYPVVIAIGTEPTLVRDVTIRGRTRTVYRDATTGRFTKAPKAEKLNDDQVRKAF